MKITWILPAGEKTTADVSTGIILMKAAVDNNITNIIGEFGGCLSCAICQVYVDVAWLA